MNLKEKIQYLKERPFVKDTAILQVGTIFSTLFSFVASIIFVRYLGASLYGTYIIIFAFVSLVSVFLDWGASYGTLTKLPEYYARKDKESIKAIIIYFIKTELIIFFGFILIIIIIAPIISEIFYHDKSIGELARFIILANMIKVPFNLLVNILQAIRKIKYLTILENVDKIFFTFFPVIFVIFGGGLIGLVSGHLLASVIFFVYSIIQYAVIAKNDQLMPSWELIFKDLLRIDSKHYLRLGFSVAIDKKLGSLYSSLPLNFLAFFVPPAQLAYFKIAFSYITLNKVFIGPISRLLTVQLPKSKNFGVKIFKRDFFKVCLSSLSLSIVLVLGLIIMAPFLVTFFYGESFSPAIKIIYFLSFYSMLTGLGVGTSPFFRTANKMKVIIAINFIWVILGMPIVYFLISHYLIQGYIYFLTFAYMLQLGTIYYFIYRFFKKDYL